MSEQKPHLEPEWWKQATYQSLLDLGKGCIKLTSWLNGGALAITAGFLGQNWSSATSDLIRALKCGMFAFSIGLFLSVLAHIFGYIGQRYLYAEKTGQLGRRSKWNNYLHWLLAATVAVIISTLLFIIGAFSAIPGVS